MQKKSLKDKDKLCLLCFILRFAYSDSELTQLAPINIFQIERVTFW